MSYKTEPMIDKEIVISELNAFILIIEQIRSYDESLANNLQVTYNLLERLIENDDNNFIIETAETRQLLEQTRNIIGEYNIREYRALPTTTSNAEETTIDNTRSPEKTNKITKFFITIAYYIKTLFPNNTPRVYVEELYNENITEDMTSIIKIDSNSASFSPFNQDLIGKEGI